MQLCIQGFALSLAPGEAPGRTLAIGEKKMITMRMPLMMMEVAPTAEKRLACEQR